ncbi:MAG TPA: SGNH/GDSL hydrolase family protein [Methylomirabilota bacterium]|nr:SGNH/GDSL hydrolase family protein [Methylomirabilota bacterium]
MSIKAIVLAAVFVAVAACAGGRADRARMLPLDPAAPIVYAALGDSTVEGVGASGPDANYVSRLHARLRAVYPRARAVNLGLGGATSADVVTGQLERAVLLRPHLVTLSIGPNDITGHVPRADYERNVETIFRRLTQETSAVVVANLLPDLAITPRFRGREAAPAVGGLTVSFNEALARLAGRYGVEVVDLYAASRAELPLRPDLVAADGYHPSDLGYARWAELLWAGVERRLAAR